MTNAHGDWSFAIINMYKTFIFFVCLSICLALVTCDLNKEEGAECEWEGFKGTCVNSRRCFTALDMRGDKPPVCTQKGDEPIICCTDCELVNDTRNVVVSPTGGLYWKDGRTFRDHCLQYIDDLPHKCAQEGYYGGISRRADSEKKCHSFGVWAIGGAPPEGVNPSEHPYEALIGFGDNLETAQWLTSGTIISDKFILTGAYGYSVITKTHPLKYAALGVKNRKDDKNTWQIRNIKKMHQHPEYDGSGGSRFHDLALLELETPITFNGDVLPACLPDPSAEFYVSTAKIASWKEPDMNATTFLDKPRMVELHERTALECVDKIIEQEGPTPILFQHAFPKGINTRAQACYGHDNACMNVIGSSIVVNTYMSRCMNTIIGVHAHGSCGTVVFNRVAPYVSWIESIVWP